MMKLKSKKGFTLVEIMIVVAIIGLLAAIAIPNFVRARLRARSQACWSNLRQIDGAKQIWAIDRNQLDTAIPAADWSDIVPDYVARIPVCPTAGAYNVTAVNADTVCANHGTVTAPIEN